MEQEASKVKFFFLENKRGKHRGERPKEAEPGQRENHKDKRERKEKPKP